MRRFLTALVVCLILGSGSVAALEVDAAFLRKIEKLRKAVEWNDREVFALTLQQSMQAELSEFHSLLGVNSQLQPDQVQLPQLYAGLLLGWLIITLDEAVDQDPEAWNKVRLLSGAVQGWLQQTNPMLAADLKRAIRLAQLTPDPQMQRSLLREVRPLLIEIVNSVFDPVAARNATNVTLD